MRYFERETIAYTFTAYYHGYIGDLGPSPSLYVNVYSVLTNQLVDIPSLVQVDEIVQVSNDVLFVGTIFVNKLGNTLPVGDYRIKLSVQAPAGVVDLLYAPIEVVANDHPFAVSFIGREEMTPDEVHYHFRDVIDPGVKIGFQITPGTESYSYDIHPGVLMTAGGVKIEHGKTARNAVHIEPAGENSRVDIVCVHYDNRRRDEQLSIRPPRFHVLQGGPAPDMPPSVPPFYTPIAYALVPENTGYPGEIQFVRDAIDTSKRPFHVVGSLQDGDGIRDVFEFPLEYIRSTTTAFVDGVPQYLHLGDYEELPSRLNRGAIRFLNGEVPQLGQKVTLSGQTHAGAYFEHDYSLYTPPSSPTPPQITTYTRTSLISEFVADTYIEGFWPDLSGGSPGFQQTEIPAQPLRGWELAGNYVYFDGLSQLLVPSLSALNASEFTIVILGDAREAASSINQMRIISKRQSTNNPHFSLSVVNDPLVPKVIAMHGGSANPVQINLTPAQWVGGPFKISCRKNAANLLTLQFNNVIQSGTVQSALPSSEPWVLGGEDTLGPGSGYEGKLFLVLLYNRILTQPEIDAI